jgi:hypothetical protein
MMTFFRYIIHRIKNQIKTNVSAPASDAFLGSVKGGAINV